jgi:hypothetical protein
MQTPRFSITVVILAAFACGCSSGRRETAPVAGQVTYAGKPVPAGRIMFWPNDGGPPAAGELDSAGRYSLTTYETGDGAIAGPHRVTIDTLKVNAPSEPAKSLQDELKPGGNSSLSSKSSMEYLAPKKYSVIETSPLTATVQAGKNVCDFNLTP